MVHAMVDTMVDAMVAAMLDRMVEERRQIRTGLAKKRYSTPYLQLVARLQLTIHPTSFQYMQVR